MDKAFWQSIIDNEYVIPPDFLIQTLTSELLSYLGSGDSALREGTAYTILDVWIHRNYYLRSPGFAQLTFIEQQPIFASALLPLVENTLSQIRTWC